ncbi:ABC transporter substrate-binding protein [Bacillus sp. FSL K6-3431]|uniref:ABC transporter substrate-binding protein n=1 Tax=Bacillus sp. FSL K6-3431 TaxID=2921500 RepID=UPI0030FB7426
MERIGNYVEENYPNLTMEHIDWDGTSTQLQENYGKQIIPDVLLAFTGQQPLEELDMVYPLEEMIEAFNVDLDQIEPVLLDEIRSRDKSSRLVGLPQEVAQFGLYYNKDIFDLFGVPYPNPDESMSWDEVLELAKKMTGKRGEATYCGLDFNEGSLAMVPLWQLSANMTDPDTGEVLLLSDPKFTKYMDLMGTYYNIPGIQDESCSFINKNTAMMINWHGFAGLNIGDSTEEAIKYIENIDVVPLPTWSDLPNVGPTPQGIHPWVINNYSEQKEAALQFILAGVTKEYQIKLASVGTPSVLNIPEVTEQYGVNKEILQGKNTAAFLHNTPAKPSDKKSYWDQYVNLDMKEFLESGLDIKEFLRVTSEAAEVAIQDAKAQQE